MSPDDVRSDFEIVHYNIGNVVNGVPRMNLFFKVSVPQEAIKQTEDVTEARWFSKEEFLQQEMHASYNKDELVKVIFTD